MKDSKSMWTPLATSAKLTAEDPKSNATITDMEIGGKRVSYSSVVGSLMYTMMGTRPDIAYTVGVLSCFSTNPKCHHWAAEKWVLHYLNTSDMELKFDGNNAGIDMSFYDYSNAN